MSVGTHVPLHICGRKKTQWWDTTSVSSSTFFETGSLVTCCSVCQAGWSISFQGLSCLCQLPFCRSAGAANAHKHIQAFVDSGVWGSSHHACMQFSFFPPIFKHCTTSCCFRMVNPLRPFCKSTHFLQVCFRCYLNTDGFPVMASHFCEYLNLICKWSTPEQELRIMIEWSAGPEMFEVILHLIDNTMSQT